MHWGISVKTKLTWLNKITVQKGDVLSCVKSCLALDGGAVWKPVCTWDVGLPVHCCSFQLCVALCGRLRKHVGKCCCATAPAKAVCYLSALRGFSLSFDAYHDLTVALCMVRGRICFSLVLAHSIYEFLGQGDAKRCVGWDACLLSSCARLEVT